MFFENAHDRNEWIFCVSVTLLWVFGLAVGLLS